MYITLLRVKLNCVSLNGYRQISNTSHTLVGNTLGDPSDAFGASPVALRNCIFILNLIPRINGFAK